jgi:hypothetical protein
MVNTNKVSKMTTKSKTKKVDDKQVTNGAEALIDMTVPYSVLVTIRGVVPCLFHAWNTESVEEKAASAKNSIKKKTDDLESYVYRTSDGLLGIAGKCFQAALCEAGKSFQDPRSPRKSARDLIKSSIQVLDYVAPFTPPVKTWDYEDKQRVCIQRASITRIRPAMKEGWTATFEIIVTAPEYISSTFLHELVDYAGKRCGVLDFRPSYGRFQITKFEPVKLS